MKSNLKLYYTPEEKEIDAEKLAKDIKHAYGIPETHHMPLGFEGTFLFDAPPLYLSPGVEEELEKDPGLSEYIDKAIKSFIEDSENESTEEERNEYAANRYLFGHNCWITVRCASPVEQLVISTYRHCGLIYFASEDVSEYAQKRGVRQSGSFAGSE